MKYKKIRKLKASIFNLFNRIFFYLLRIYYKVFNIKASITCFSGDDGGGAQLQRIMSVALICDYYDIEFVFTPINYIDSLAYTSDTDLVSKWNNLINFSDIYGRNYDYELKINSLFLCLIRLPWTNELIAIRHAHKFADLYTQHYRYLIDNKKINIDMSKSSKKYPLCIHLRRPSFPSFHPTYKLELERQISPMRFNDTIKSIENSRLLKHSRGVVYIASHDSETKVLEKAYPSLIFDDVTDVFEVAIVGNTRRITKFDSS